MLALDEVALRLVVDYFGLGPRIAANTIMDLELTLKFLQCGLVDDDRKLTFEKVCQYVRADNVSVLLLTVSHLINLKGPVFMTINIHHNNFTGLCNFEDKYEVEYMNCYESYLRSV
jgi:hypothetical protein